MYKLGESCAKPYSWTSKLRLSEGHVHKILYGTLRCNDELQRGGRGGGALTLPNFIKYVDRPTKLSCDWLFCNCLVTFGHSSADFYQAYSHILLSEIPEGHQSTQVASKNSSTSRCILDVKIRIFYMKYIY